MLIISLFNPHKNLEWHLQVRKQQYWLLSNLLRITQLDPKHNQNELSGTPVANTAPDTWMETSQRKTFQLVIQSVAKYPVQHTLGLRMGRPVCVDAWESEHMGLSSDGL